MRRTRGLSDELVVIDVAAGIVSEKEATAVAPTKDAARGDTYLPSKKLSVPFESPNCDRWLRKLSLSMPLLCPTIMI